MLKITFLGTGGILGVPAWGCNCETCKSLCKKNKRTRSSLLVEINDKKILIDFGPDCRSQLLKNKVKHLDYVLLTHSHDDHKNGYEVFSFKQDIKLLIPQQVFSLLNQSKIDWLKKRNPDCNLEEFKPFKVGDFEIDTVQLLHSKDWKDKTSISFGYLFKSKKFSFAYCTDYNNIVETEKLNNLDLIISDGNGMGNENKGHVGINGSVEVFKKYKPKMMYLTHIKHTTEHKKTNKYLKQFGNIKLAYDGLKIKIK